MKDGLYHQLLGIPAGACRPFTGVSSLFLTAHARQARTCDQYGRIEIEDGDEVEVFDGDIIEIEIRSGAPVKAVVRVAYNDWLDLVIAMNVPANGKAVVRTVWFNLKSDRHRTLDRQKYVLLRTCNSTLPVRR